MTADMTTVGLFYTPGDTADYLKMVNLDMDTLDREILGVPTLEGTKFLESWQTFVTNWREFFRRGVSEDWATWLQRGIGGMQDNISRWIEKERGYKQEFERLTGIASRAKPEQRLSFLRSFTSSLTSTQDLGLKLALAAAGVTALYFWLRSR